MYPTPHLALLIAIIVSGLTVIVTVILSAYILFRKMKGYYTATKQQVTELVTQTHNLTTSVQGMSTRVQKKLDALNEAVGDDPDLTAAINEIKSDVASIDSVAADTVTTNTNLASGENITLPPAS